MRYGILLWDIDGTVLDFLASEREAVRKCFGIFGLGTCTDGMLEDYSSINVGYWQRLERGELTKQEILEMRFRDFFAKYGIDPSVAPDFNHEYQIRLGDTVVFNPNALETLEYFRGRVLQCAVTNGTERAQTNKLRLSGLDRVFDGVFISDVIGAEKPSPAFFDAVFSDPVLAGCNRSDALIVGDSQTSDIKGANNAGIDCCFYNPAGVPLKEGLHAEYDIRDLKELMRIVE